MVTLQYCILVVPTLNLAYYDGKILLFFSVLPVQCQCTISTFCFKISFYLSVTIHATNLKQIYSSRTNQRKWSFLAHVHKGNKNALIINMMYNTGLFKVIVWVLTTCRTQYTWDRSIYIFLFNRTTLQVFVTYLTGALYVHPLWFYKHQHDNWVRSACQRWWFQWQL